MMHPLASGLLLHDDSVGAGVGQHLPGEQQQEEHEGELPGGADGERLESCEKYQH